MGNLSRPRRTPAGTVDPVEIVDAGTGDRAFLDQMWHTAAFWQPDRDVMEPALAKRIPELARYIADLDRAGDVALIATDGDTRLGAAWYRLFTADEPGYGFVADDVPELAIGVTAEARGTGVGTALLEQLLERAGADGYRAISLSVNRTNPARQLYERFGFETVGGDDESFTLVRRLSPE
jgi:GNAT superfamily N-acetyltransferase